CPQQSPSVLEDHPDSIYVDHPVRAFKAVCHLFHDVKFRFVRTFHPDFRRGYQLGKSRELRRERFAAAVYDLDPPAGRIKSIVVSEIAVCKKHVTGHLACQLGVLLLHFRLDQRMPGLEHDRIPAQTLELVIEKLRALDLADERRTGLAGENFTAKD